VKESREGEYRTEPLSFGSLHMHLLEKHNLTKEIFEQTRRYLTAKGLILREGTIVDATIINAPSSTKNRDKARDPEMKQTKKGNQWYIGMKAHVGTDTGKGLVQRTVFTDAAIHDSRVTRLMSRISCFVSWVLASTCQILLIPWVIILLLFIRYFTSSLEQGQPS
jgi:hypothetical protein